MSFRDTRALAVLYTVIASVTGTAAYLDRHENGMTHLLYALHALVWSVVASAYWRRAARAATNETSEKP